MDIAEVLKRAKAPEREVPIYLDGDLYAEHGRLDAELVETRQAEATSMADTGKAAKLAKQIRDIEERMKASKVVFRLRSITGYQREEWLTAHQPRERRNEPFNTATGQVPLVAMSCIDPAMTLEDADTLYKTIGAEQFGALTAAAWGLAFGASDVPFSVAASVTLRGTEQNSK